MGTIVCSSCHKTVAYVKDEKVSTLYCKCERCKAKL
ncbi:GapA-binding peptide SR1P [Domibacillus robiginosus]|nr:GapA-binding peptide SR1P [Domibacillus robiginosus]